MIHTRVVVACPATKDNNKLRQERAAFVHCLQQAQYKRHQARMNEDYEGENAGVHEQLKDLLSKTSTPSCIGIAAICRKTVIVKKMPRKTTKTRRSTWLGTLHLYMH